MTAKSKLIKTHLMKYDEVVDNPPQALAVPAPQVLWTPQDDITIIGMESYNEIEREGTGWDSGNLLCISEISRVGQFYRDGALMFCSAVVECGEATVGINANQCVLGSMFNMECEWFPEGYGVDLDDGETLYLNCYAHNEMSNPKHFYFWSKIYYVER